jgi:DNA-binding CsgD family transcriptional regulator
MPAAQADWPLIEREAELSVLYGVLADAMEGRGRVAYVEGPSGGGKTALLRLARSRAIELRMQVLEASGSDLEVEYPFGTVLTLVESWSSNATQEQRSHLVSGRGRLAGAMLSGAGSGVDLAGDEFSLIHSLYWNLVNLCDSGPVLLAVDDAHLADDPSLRFLNYIAARIEDLPVALVIAVRSGDARAAAPLMLHLAAVDNVTEVRPEGLSKNGVATLLQREDPELQMSPELTRRCWMVTGGNPLLVSEISAAVREEGRDWLDQNADRLETFAPPLVRIRVLQRLSRLGPSALALARAYAVLRDKAPLELAARLAEVSLDEAVSLLDRLDEAQILSGGPQPHIRHPMILACVYEDIPNAQLAALHTRAAALLHGVGERAESVASHLLVGMPTAADWAVDVLIDAATTASGKGSPNTAIRYLRQALTLVTVGPRRIRVLVDLGLLEAAQGESPSVLHLEEALDLMEDSVDKARCLHQLGTTLYRYGRHAEAAQAFERCIAHATLLDPELALEAEAAWIFTAYYLDTVLETARKRLEVLTAGILERGPRVVADRVLLAIAGLHASLSTPPCSVGASHSLEALRDGVLLQSQTSAGLVAHVLALALTFSDQLDEASELVSRLMHDADGRQHMPALAEATFMRSQVEFARGNITDAWIHAEDAVNGIAKGWVALAPLAQGTLAQCLVEREELDVAEALLTASNMTLDNPALGSWLHMAWGELKSAQNDHTGALASFLEAGRVLSPFSVTNPAVLRWRSRAGHEARLVGDIEMARDLIDEELSLARAFESPRSIAVALTAKATLLPRDERLALLAEALGLLEERGTDLELARTLLEQGRALRQLGKRAESREPLGRAMDLAQRSGALATARRAAEELKATGARPRQRFSTGLQALTPSERRVADLVAKGLSNREVAEATFVARNTVIWHLRHVYQKLGIESRAELAEALDQAAVAPRTADLT